ncbi:hypothetical protein AB0O91_10115 [Kitasatospora sp. NPDC089797]|uniref:hypothetical protein n=1 Tax=Kitasatospora sp. NPDC089797 TaxID=3155298 RepID=UPI00341B5AD2
MSPAKVPVLLEQMNRFWNGQCRPADTVESAGKRYTDLHCSGRGDTLFELSVVGSTTDSSVEVRISAQAFMVRNQREKDYGAPPIGERPTGREPVPDLDDPYWSH